MEKAYLEKYYPDGISAEERLFEAGRACTSIPLANWWKAIVIGVALAVFGLIIAVADYETFVFGMLVFCVGDLCVLVGAYGISRYHVGLHYLERAELLYNTRMAGRTAVPEETASKKVEAAPVEKKPVAPSGWKCSCGKHHEDYEFACICGVTKMEAKAAKPQEEKKNPAVRTANGWRCACGKEHPNYISTCECGVNKPSIR